MWKNVEPHEEHNQLDNGSVQSKKRTRGRPRGSKNARKKSEQTALSFTHDPAKYGHPLQDWTTADKCVWLLYVVTEKTKTEELSAKQLVDTFNQHFRQAGAIKQSNVSRDLGRLKARQASLVGQNANERPATWYLTAAGNKEAKELIKKALGQE